MSFAQSHYAWLDKNLKTIFERVGIADRWSPGFVGAHGDKCYSYRYDWDKAGIPFEHGVAMYLLTYVTPFRQEVRETVEGWVDPSKWIMDNYARFKPHLEDLTW